MKYLVFSILLVFSVVSNAGRDVASSKVVYVYQLDGSSTTFEFASSVPHSCGSSLYRVKSEAESVANRKFALVLTAFTTNGNLAFHDREQCEGNRSVVTWVRLIR